MNKNNSNMLVVILLVAVAFLLGMNIKSMKGDSSNSNNEAGETTLTGGNNGFYKPEGNHPEQKEEAMVKCPICKGYGSDPRDMFKKCFGCHRVGLVRESECKRLASMKENEWPYVEKVYYDCPMCFGTKQVGGRSSDLICQNPPCTMCDENGKVDAQGYREAIKLMEQMRRDGIPINFMPPFDDPWF